MQNGFVPFLLTEILNFQCSTHLIGVGSLSNNKKVTTVVLKEIVEPASDLTTTKYHYKELRPYDIPFELLDNVGVDLLNDKKLCVFSGTVLVGVDISKIKYSIDEDEKSIVIKLPEPYIIAHEIYDEDTKVYSVKDSLLVSEEGLEKNSERLGEWKKDINDHLLEDEEFMDTVRTNTQNVIKDFLGNSQYTKDYSVEFKW